MIVFDFTYINTQKTLTMSWNLWKEGQKVGQEESGHLRREGTASVG